MTDDDRIGELLRETFADKEKLVDNWPDAIESEEPVRSRVMPALLAAAAVLLLLGGVVVAVQGSRGPTANPLPGATSPSVEARPAALEADVQIWSAAIVGILAKEPRPKWPTVHVLDAPHEGTARGTPFTGGQKTAIAATVRPTATIDWVVRRPVTDTSCQPAKPGGPFVTLGPIVHRVDHVEVAVNYWEGCLSARWLTFRLDEKNGTWQVTGTVGPEAVS